MKRVMRRGTIDGNVVILDYIDAAEHLRSRFCTDGWQQTHGLDSKYTINEVSIFNSYSKDIDRRENEVYESVVGIRKSFGYMALGEAECCSDGSIVGARIACWQGNLVMVQWTAITRLPSMSPQSRGGRIRWL